MVAGGVAGFMTVGPTGGTILAVMPGGVNRPTGLKYEFITSGR